MGLINMDLPPLASSARTDSLDLHYYIEAIRKRWFQFLLLPLIAIVAASYYVNHAVPTYRASAKLLIESQETKVVSIEELIGADTKNADYYKTQFALLKSRSLARQVIDALGLWTSAELLPARPGAEQESFLHQAITKVQGLVFDSPQKSSEPTPVDVDDSPEASRKRHDKTISNFLEHLTITPLKDTKLVSITYESIDPDLAANVANSVGEQYITQYLDTKMERTTKAAEWLASRVAELRETLNSAEEKLLKFKRENDLIQISGNVEQLSEQDLLLANSELALAQSETSAARQLYRQTQAHGSSSELLLTIPRIQNDPLVQRAKIEEASARTSLDELLLRYGPKHPKVQDARSRLQSLDNDLAEQLGRIVRTIEGDYTTSQERLAAARSRLSLGRKEIQALGEKSFELEALEREVAINLEIYQTFFSRMTEARSTHGLDAANASISDLAIAPTIPATPRKRVIITLAGLCALLLSTLVVFLREYLDETVSDSRDAEVQLGVPVIGLVPVQKQPMRLPFSRKSAQIGPENKLSGIFVEAIKSIRTTVSLTDMKNHHQIIVVTSSVPGEGKSSLSLNLAHSFAQMERVLLIDGDMRRPTMGYLRHDKLNTAGLSSLLTGKSVLKDCLSIGVLAGAFDVIPSGPIPKQPLELISSPAFERLLAKLRRHYDRIIIDSPPGKAVSDALVLAKLGDNVIYVVKAHATPVEVVRRGLQKLRTINAPLTGLVLNQVRPKLMSPYERNYNYSAYHDSSAQHFRQLQQSTKSRNCEHPYSVRPDYRGAVSQDKGAIVSRSARPNGVEPDDQLNSIKTASAFGSAVSYSHSWGDAGVPLVRDRDRSVAREESLDFL